jgi:DNA-binding transcriptional ArsR family regulator
MQDSPMAAAEPPTLDQLKAKAPEAAAFLRLLANPNRLILLCHIATGERSVTEIQHDLGLKQPALSQQLADLRRSGLVQTRRESRTIFYAIKDGRAAAVMAMLQAIFCGNVPSSPPAPSPRHPPAPERLGDAAQFARLGPDT